MKCRSIIAAVLLIGMVLSLLTACGCEHEWKPATCAEPATCTLCGATDGEADGEHDYRKATCTEPKTCNVCGETSGEPAGHTKNTANICTRGVLCSVCETSLEPPLGHDFAAATCLKDRTCKNCGVSEQGTALGHDFMQATCTEGMKCRRCGRIEQGTALGHDYANGFTCQRCGQKNPAAARDAEIIQMLADIGSDAKLLAAAADCITPSINLYNINGNIQHILDIQDDVDDVRGYAVRIAKDVEPFCDDLKIKRVLYDSVQELTDPPIYLGSIRDYLSDVKGYVRDVKHMVDAYTTLVDSYTSKYNL